MNEPKRKGVGLRTENIFLRHEPLTFYFPASEKET